MKIKGADQNCRYLAILAGDRGNFDSFLKSVGCEMPSSISYPDIVRFGWIKPVLRIKIPESFILSWDNYPFIPRHGNFIDADSWAANCWNFFVGSMPGWGDYDFSDNEWYIHPFDRANN
jgi:hypothetical protein